MVFSPQFPFLTCSSCCIKCGLYLPWYSLLSFLHFFFLQTKHCKSLHSKKSRNMPCHVSCLSVSFTFICDAHLLSSFNNWKSFPNLSFSSYTFCTTFLCDKTFYHPHLRVGNNFSSICLSVCLSFCNFWVTGARDIIWVYRYILLKFYLYMLIIH